jgi:hypothetical protein
MTNYQHITGTIVCIVLKKYLVLCYQFKTSKKINDENAILKRIKRTY